MKTKKSLITNSGLEIQFQNLCSLKKRSIFKVIFENWTQIRSSYLQKNKYTENSSRWLCLHTNYLPKLESKQGTSDSL